MPSNTADSFNLMLTLAYTALIGICTVSTVYVIPFYINVVVTSTLIVYIGCHRSLHLLTSEADGGIAEKDKDMLSTGDALRFPLVGSCALGGLYLAFKYYKEYASLILAIYFSFVGIYTLTSTYAPVLQQLLHMSPKKYGIKKTTVPVVGEVELLLNISEMLMLIVAIVIISLYNMKDFIELAKIVLAYLEKNIVAFTPTISTVIIPFLDTLATATKLFHKHFFINNILGVSFCIQAIEKVSIGSYYIGTILLSGLFFYDIFWVFATEVMVSVAKNLDGPIKLLFPRKFKDINIPDSKNEFSLLGLGDIVIPGFFIALLLRFDAVNAKVNKDSYTSPFAKPFFIGNIISYALGLSVTIGVMMSPAEWNAIALKHLKELTPFINYGDFEFKFFHNAQPALLYLVPFCIGGSMLVGLATGKFNQMMKYNEETKAADKKND